MNERSRHVLEYEKILALLMKQAATVVGKQAAEQLTPVIDIDAARLLQAETDEAVHILRLNKSVPLAHIEDISGYLQRSKIGSVLDATACLHIAQVVYVARQVKTFIENSEEDLPLLKDIVTKIYSLRHIETDIKRKIDEHGEIVDDASTALRSIRQSVRTYEARIRERLHQLTRTKSKMLSESIVTIRNNRYVLPVKHEYRAAIGGIVHDQSASGQTLFMEPRAVIELNNALQQAYVKEQQEIEKILFGLTNVISEHADELAENVATIAEIDLIVSRAKLAVQMKAAKPELNDNGIIELKRARHPLIPPEDVVANDIALGDSYHAIVITGPNTGGKTVTLKTIGLLTLMAQSGLFVPAMDGCKLAVFHKVYADIGDEQSIEQNLSTFSSHMKNIVTMMEDIDEHSLVLFDEIGAGTDPQEGAALAMALLDEVIERQARVVATTHYPELKAYGYNRESVMNASVEFDVETLRPTYRLMMGVPGRSNAFKISKRLGLQTGIIDGAKSYLGVDSKNVENMISALENTQKEAEKDRLRADELLQASTELKKELEREWVNFQTAREKLYKEAEEKAENALQQAREEAEIIVAEVRQMKDNTLWKEHEWIEAKKLLEEARPALQQEKQVDAKDDTTILQVGDEIKHRTLQQTGQVIEKKNEQEYVIQVGMMKVTAKRKDLEYVGKSIQAEPEQSITHVTTSDQPVKTELDLRGERFEDAMLKLEEYIDRAMMQGYPRVSIIHGKGTGALRKGVEKFIHSSPYIKSSRVGAQSEGGTGVTIIEL